MRITQSSTFQLVLLSVLSVSFEMADVMVILLVRTLIVETTREEVSTSFMSNYVHSAEEPVCSFEQSTQDIGETLNTVSGREEKLLIVNEDYRNTAKKTKDNGLYANNTLHQQKMGFYLMANHMMTYIPSFVLTPVYGLWSDRHGRKFPMMIPSFGHVLSVLAYSVLAKWPKYFSWIIIIGAMLRGFAGRSVVFRMSVTSIVGDLDKTSSKSTWFSYVVASCFMGKFIGSLFAAVFQSYLSIHNSLLISSAIQLLCLIGVAFGIEETKKRPVFAKEDSIGLIDNSESLLTLEDSKEEMMNRHSMTIEVSLSNKQEHKFSNFEENSECYAADNIGELLSNNDLLQPEEEHDNLQGDYLFLSMVILASFMTLYLVQSYQAMVLQVTSAPPFNWSGTRFGYFMTAMFAAISFYLMALTPALRFLFPHGKEGEASIVLLSTIACVVCNLWTGISVLKGSDWQIFAAGLIGGMGVANMSVVRSLASGCVSSESQGRIMSILSSLDAVASVVGPPFHTLLYVFTLGNYGRSFVFFVMAMQCAPMIPVNLWIFARVRRIE